MTRILVTGGTGALGSAVVNILKTTDHQVRILSRKESSNNHQNAVEWAQGDIATGDGLANALNQVDIVVNCTGDFANAYATDVLGVKRLAEDALEAGVRHFFHISIVGIDRIDYPFYQYKVEAENALITSGVSYSIQRLPQFYALLHGMMTRLKASADGYVLPMDGDALFQAIDTRDAAAYILPLFLAAPAGRLPDVGGPEILWVEKIARTYLEARGIANPTFINPQSGAFFTPQAVEGFRDGMNTVPDNRYGQILWTDYVREHLPVSEAHSL